MATSMAFLKELKTLTYVNKENKINKPKIKIKSGTSKNRHYFLLLELSIQEL